MNKDQIKGRVEQAKEHVKEASGKIVVNDTSMLSLSSPFRIAGKFAAPTAGPDRVARGARAGLAIALGVANPFLALLATIKTGPGQDADCTGSQAIASKASNPASKAGAKPAAH